MEEYLLPTYCLDSDHPDIGELVAKLIEPTDSDSEKARKLFYYVRDSIHYDMYAATNHGDAYKASSILQKGRGYCLQKAIILAAMGRAAGIPSRLVLVAIKNYKAPPEVFTVMRSDIFFPHAYNQFYINSNWISAAATFDKSICEKINVPWGLILEKLPYYYGEDYDKWYK